MSLYYETDETLLGEIYIITTRDKVTDILLFKEDWQTYLEKNTQIRRGSLLGRQVIKQLQEYFAGSRQIFDLPLHIEGTAYSMKVWEELRKIGYGQVASYQDIADRIGNPKSVRAIGQANKANRLPIVIPCHRIIGKNGGMVGYAGDRIETKAKLLELEKRMSKK
ncbi:MAG: methylated-DNA--[protein]-cysteine S-methyltransferase [Cellulosilyticaceae bacterium]